MAKKLNDNSKFYTININKLNDILDNTKDSLSYTELRVLVYLLKFIEFDTNIIIVAAIHKNYILKNMGVSQNSLNKLISKLKKMTIFEKVAKDTYKVNPEVIKYGENEFEGGDFIKASANNLFNSLKDTDEQPTAIDIKIFIYLLTNITYHSQEERFDGNTIMINPEIKKAIFEKYDISSRTFDNFMKRMKGLNIITKINNTIYRVNPAMLVFGGEFEQERKVIKETAVKLPTATVNSSKMSQFFERKGGNDNE